jgi:hypothetical protein
MRARDPLIDLLLKVADSDLNRLVNHARTISVHLSENRRGRSANRGTTLSRDRNASRSNVADA